MSLLLLSLLSDFGECDDYNDHDYGEEEGGRLLLLSDYGDYDDHNDSDDSNNDDDYENYDDHNTTHVIP